MSSTDPPAERIRFGEFELSLRTRELTTDGETVDLQEQPFLVLKMLLEHPGELVFREQLIERLWDADTHVDFEHSLNKAVKRLREALKDSADQPRFIETLPRRGYRFIGELGTAKEVGAAPPAGAEKIASPPSPRSAKRIAARWSTMAVVAGVLFLSIPVFYLTWMKAGSTHSTAISSGSIHSLAVLPLENLSGQDSQEYFADAMTDELTTDLGQIGSLRVI